MPTVETATNFASDLWDIFRRHNDGYETDLPADRVAARDAAIRIAELARVVKRLRDEQVKHEALQREHACDGPKYAAAKWNAEHFRVAADLLEREGAGT